MDLELWWLLPIPALFFAFGWVAARIDIKHLLRESRTLPASYFRGLNFLLEEQPDKAIESFVEVVKVDPGTSELHFALGRLFRRQGEVERAIRAIPRGRFDYLWLINPPPLDRKLTESMHPVWRGPGSILYRINP